MNGSMNLLENELVKPYLGLKTYKDINLPLRHDVTDKETIINDFIHLHHPIFTQLKQNLIDKTIPVSDIPLKTAPPFITPRKSYELTHFSNHIQKLHSQAPFEFIIDIGAGNSNLSRYHMFPTVSIETDAKSQRVYKKMNGLLKTEGRTISQNVHYTRDVDDDETLSFIRSRQGNNDMEKPRCLIVGLDCCGDLSNTILDYLVNGVKNLDVVGCMFVSCCIHKCSGFISDKLKDVDVNFGMLGTSDLRALNYEDIINRFETENDDDFNFAKWCYLNGFLTQVMETLVIFDKVEYSRQYSLHLGLEIMFDFQKSSRNIASICMK